MVLTEHMEMTELMTELLVTIERRGADGDDGADDGAAGEDGATRRQWR